MNANERPALIGIDWGSTNLRVALLAATGTLLDRKESPQGVFAVRDHDFDAVLWRVCGDWIAQYRVPMLACGMIGSRQGIVDVPYVTCPAHATDLARALSVAELKPQHTEDPPMKLFIVPGLRTGSDAAGWDVVRGEETQLLGIPASSGVLFVLPGTHSKWMQLGPDGRIDTFQTYMTGELFDVLRHHGSLARVMAEPHWSPDAFQNGLTEARDDALENRLFRVRTAGLMGRYPGSALADYLSGLLIGAEVKAGARRFADAAAHGPIAVVGHPELTRRYVIALECFGLRVHEIAGDVVFDGLLSIARLAGLIGSSTSSDSTSPGSVG